MEELDPCQPPITDQEEVNDGVVEGESSQTGKMSLAEPEIPMAKLDESNPQQVTPAPEEDPGAAFEARKIVIQLRAEWSYARSYSAWLHAVITLTVVVFAIVYARNVSILSRVFFDDPQTLILTLNILGLFVALLLAGLVMTASDNLRWKLSSRRAGVSLINFVTLAGSTSPFRLCQVLFSKRVVTCRGEEKGDYAICKTSITPTVVCSAVTLSSNLY